MLSNAASLARVFLAAFLLLLLPTPAVVASPAPSPEPEPEPEPGLLGLNIPIVDPLLNLLNNPPPKLLRTTNPTSNCTNINGGELQCCRAMVAGDVQLIVWLAAIYGYQLNPNDINGLNCAFLSS